LWLWSWGSKFSNITRAIIFIITLCFTTLYVDCE
jgi:hypothetical protein